MDVLLNIDQENLFLIGRDEPLELFSQYLLGDSNSNDHLIWNIYGTAGVGKSFLIDSYRRLAFQAGALMLYVDSRDFNHTGDQLCRQLLRQMNEEKVEGAELIPPVDALEACLNRLRQHAEKAKIIVALDTYEEMGELDGWLREQLFKRLPDNMLVLIAGRYKLKGDWIVSPTLRKRIRYMPLGNLSIEECASYLHNSGITDEEQIKHIWRKTLGHPLAISLAAFIRTQTDWTSDSEEDSEWFDHLAKVWLREVLDVSLREMVESAAILLHFNREVLQFVLDRDINDDAFERLISLSFVRRTDRGWMLHDLIRTAMRKQLEERTPDYYERLRGRSAHYFAARIRHSSAYRNTEWEVGELFYYTGSSVIRTFIHAYARGRYVWEPLTLDNIEEGEAYLYKRRQSATPLTLSAFDPDTDERHEEFASEEDMSLTIKHLDLRALVELDQQAVMLLKSTEGEAIGLAAIIPINVATLPYLQSDPFAGPYLESLSLAKRKLLDVTPPGQAGWFIRTIDYMDWRNQDMVVESMFLMFAYMCSGGIFVTSPPPLPFFNNSHQELGFQVVPNVLHHNYDGRTPTPTFVLDTRGEKLGEFLNFLLKRGGYPREIGMSSGSDERLTGREREIATLVLEGLTNLEIANELFVSEITVKKHLSSIYAKLSIKGRSQLIKLLVGKRSIS